MRIERTVDVGLIRSVVTHPAIYPHITDDASPAADEFEPPIADAIYWLSICDGKEVAGVFLVHPWNSVTFEIHTCILPRWRGANARVATAAVLAWIFTNTACLKVVTHVPITNRLALRLAVDSGLVVEGINRQSFLKHGQIIDQTLLGIARVEWQSCLQQQ